MSASAQPRHPIERPALGAKGVTVRLISVVAAFFVSACGHTVVAGQPLSARFNPQKVSGLTVSDDQVARDLTAPHRLDVSQIPMTVALIG